MNAVRAMVASVLLYRAHTCALSPKQLQQLELVQRKQLRQILARSRWRPCAGSSHSQTSNEDPGVRAALYIEQSLQGRWVGHVPRMPNYRLARQLFSVQCSPPPRRRIRCLTHITYL